MLSCKVNDSLSMCNLMQKMNDDPDLKLKVESLGLDPADPT